MEQRSARKAHNLEVGGSNPSPATKMSLNENVISSSSIPDDKISTKHVHIKTCSIDKIEESDSIVLNMFGNTQTYRLRQTTFIDC